MKTYNTLAYRSYVNHTVKHNIPLCPYPNFDSIGDYSIHDVLRKRVKVFVYPSHELRFQQVATAAVILKHPHVQLHREV